MFPSPYGDYGSYLVLSDLLSLIAQAICFRPLTGIMVLIYHVCSDYYSSETMEFPSPYGDYGSYQHPATFTLDSNTQQEFPSPYGDYGSYLCNDSK